MRDKMLLVIVGAVMLLAACSQKAPQNSSVPTSGPGGVTPTAAAGRTGEPVGGGADRTAICAGYQKAEADTEAKMTVILPKAAEAMADASKAPAVVSELKTTLTSFETALRAEAGRSADPELKAAIEADVAVLVKALQDLAAAGNDMTSAFAAITSDQFTAAGEKVRELCAR